MNIALFASLVLVTIAAVFDIRSHRIPNWLTYPAWGLGLAIGGLTGGLDGLLSSAAGFAVTFFPLFLMFAAGTIGGGDVKLMGGVGAILGFPSGLNALISAILVGGFFAAIILLWQGRLLPILRYAAASAWSKVSGTPPAVDEPPERKDAFPFGVAIALGTYLTVISIMLGAATPTSALF